MVNGRAEYRVRVAVVTQHSRQLTQLYSCNNQRADADACGGAVLPS